jgi:hypothetical protein
LLKSARKPKARFESGLPGDRGDETAFEPDHGPDHPQAPQHAGAALIAGVRSVWKIRMRPVLRVRCLCTASCLAFVLASAPASAAPKTITGELTKSGYTVIALADSGEARSAQADRGKFRLRPPAKRVTLHLRARNGTYAGPIVVGRSAKGKQAILGVKAGAKLGEVKVKPRKGYAKVERKLAERLVDAKRQARARKGVPIGAGTFGHVRSRHTRGGAPGDLDLDGIPDVLDIDDDGDLVLDDLDPSPAARSSQTANEFRLHSALPLPPEEVVNANAATLGTDDIDEALKNWGYLSMTMTIQPGVELDCGGDPDPDNPDGWIGGRRYCRRGGTGSVYSAPPPRPPFPGPLGGPYDPDGDGFGTPPDTSFGGAPSGFVLAHGASTAEIGAEDLLTQCLAGCREGGPEIEGKLNFVFVTTPALMSYSDTVGHSGSVSYPVSPGDPGTNDNGFPVGAPSGQEDIVLTLTSWRPQREPIPPNPDTGLGGDPCLKDNPPCKWIDIGGLIYEAHIGRIGPHIGGQDVGRPCPPSSFSNTDLTLLGPTDPNFMSDAGRLLDPDADLPASPAHTYTYSLNLTHCLASLGVTWNPNEDLSLGLRALSQVAGEAGTAVVFRRQP